MLRFVLRRPSKLCFFEVLRPGSLSSFAICNVLREKNSKVNILPESLQKSSLNLWTSQDRFSSQNVTVAVGFGLLVAALFGLGSVDDAKCSGKEDNLASSSEKQEERASTTPTKKTNVMRDACSGRFSSLKRAEKEKRKATQLQEIRNTRVEKAKRKLIMDSEEESLPNKVTRSSLVSLLSTVCKYLSTECCKF